MHRRNLRLKAVMSKTQHSVKMWFLKGGAGGGAIGIKKTVWGVKILAGNGPKI